MSKLLEQDTYKAIADLNLWYKIQSGDALFMADVPRIIPLRWNYFRDNWDFFKTTLDAKVDTYSEPDLLRELMTEFTDFISIQRTTGSKNNPFSDSSVFYKYHAVFEIIDINSIAQTNEEAKLIQNEIDRVNRFNKNDFRNIRKLLAKSRDEAADLIGGSDVDYNKSFNRSSVDPQSTKTPLSILQLMQYQEAVKSVDFILANIFSISVSTIDPFALAKENANNPEFNMATYSSGNLVKLNYGESLQQLANRTLGDEDKWIDIAVANGLKPPYIDEVGEAIKLISNGSGNKINISGVDLGGKQNIDKLYINQRIILTSDVNLFPDQRIITNIFQVPISGEIVLELNGDPNLDTYAIVDNANLRIFKPNTINSSLFILIPSEEPIPDDSKQDVPWFLSTSAEDEKRAKIDLFLTESGDLNFNTTGDLQLSYGIENAVQAIKLKIGVEEGSLSRHPDFGLAVAQGKTNRDTGSIKQMLIDSLNQQIGADPRFDRIETINIDYLPDLGQSATGFLISLVVKLAGSNANIPITFTVNLR